MRRIACLLFVALLPGAYSVAEAQGMAELAAKEKEKRKTQKTGKVYDEYELKRSWGHCTIEYALLVAKEAGAHELALFHHCPTHGDDRLDTILRAYEGRILLVDIAIARRWGRLSPDIGQRWRRPARA